MSKACVLRSPDEPTPRFRPAAKLVGGRVRASKSVEPKNVAGRRPREPVKDASMDGSSSSSDSSCSLTSVKTVGVVRRRRRTAGKGEGGDGVVVPRNGMVAAAAVRRRCAWITPNSDALYVTFHDEEWGRPVHDDKKIFEIFILSMALAELSWPTILSNRNMFRELFVNFDPAAIAQLSDKNIHTLKSGSGSLLSEQRLRAVVANAKQVLKIKEQFGSFACYCWRFMNHKPIVSGHRFPHQVPIKSSKAEVISKDLVRRGFQCVGPTVVYSFMQAAGMVNDHLSYCFRQKDCMNHLPCENAISINESDS